MRPRSKVERLAVERDTTQNLCRHDRLPRKDTGIGKHLKSSDKEICSWRFIPRAFLLHKSLSKRKNNQEVDIPQATRDCLPGVRVELMQTAHEVIFIEKMIYLPAAKFYSVDQEVSVVKSWKDWCVDAWSRSQSVPAQIVCCPFKQQDARGQRLLI